jgi:lipopolysaccharide transport system ATP-binding protein
LEIESDIALRATNISKAFQVIRGDWRESTLPTGNGEFHAIKNLSFEIKKGEICGLIGRNGSGKTTLLELISGIIKPTTGEIIIAGKTASVIDIGSGMHRDLSGMENIFLAGELLGMHKDEITKKLPEIISFCELQDFLFLPIKHYSSGMFIRLAFSVITHLNSDILLIDEIIGVGDMAFAEKTTARIMEVCRQGKSAIIATHSLALIRACCSTAMYLKNGILISKDDIDKVQELYVEDVLENKSLLSDNLEKTKPFQPKLEYHLDNRDENTTNQINLTECRLMAKHSDKNDFLVTDDLLLELIVEAKNETPFLVSVHINYQYNQPAICLAPEINEEGTQAGVYKFTTTISANILNQGLFTVSVFFVDENDALINAFENVLIFKINLSAKTQEQFGYSGKFSGPVFIGGNWIVEKR